MDRVKKSGLCWSELDLVIDWFYLTQSFINIIWQEWSEQCLIFNSLIWPVFFLPLNIFKTLLSTKMNFHSTGQTDSGSNRSNQVNESGYLKGYLKACYIDSGSNRSILDLIDRIRLFKGSDRIISLTANETTKSLENWDNICITKPSIDRLNVGVSRLCVFCHFRKYK